jgi:uncharacterized membrane protein YkoI
MRTVSVVVLSTLLALSAVRMGAAQQLAPAAPSYEREVPPALAALAKIGEDSARTLALAQVQGGSLEAVELKGDHGKLIWSLDIKVAGKSGIIEVNVNAADGSIINAEQQPN